MATATLSAAGSEHRALRVTLWLVQLLLAALFFMAGFMKATQPMQELSKTITWAPAVGMPLTRFIGISELAGAVGLVLPAATRIVPKLTPIAAAALALVMILAIGFHLVRGEFQVIPIPLVLGCLAAFVAWGRFTKAPIASR